MVARLKEMLTRIQVAEPVVQDNLQVFGLRWSGIPPLDYVTLDEALETGSFEVTEVSEGGDVPALLVTNTTDSRIFLMAGEQLVGAKQDRVLNASVMVPAKSKMPIPVSCVERGRWGYRSRTFSSSGSSSHAYLRRKMARDGYEGYRNFCLPTSKQGEVWREMGATRSSWPSLAGLTCLFARTARCEYLVTEANMTKGPWIGGHFNGNRGRLKGERSCWKDRTSS